MKKIIKKFLYGNTVITDFVSIPENSNSKVFLKNGGVTIDVSQAHWLLCLHPMVYGVWLPDTQLKAFRDKRFELIFEWSPNRKTVATVNLILDNKLNLAEECLLFLKQTSCRIFHLSSFESYFLYSRYYKKADISFERFKSLAAAYSFPRKVRLVSIVADDYYNLFPMDLLGPVPGSNHFVFGLRHSNISLQKILNRNKIAVAEFPFSAKEKVFALAKHHSTSPPALSSLDFPVLKTRHFQFPIPAWSTVYHEIEITESLDLGSQMFLLGNIIYSEQLSDNRDSLYEIHFFQHLLRKRYGLVQHF